MTVQKSLSASMTVDENFVTLSESILLLFDWKKIHQSDGEQARSGTVADIIISRDDFGPFRQLNLFLFYENGY